MSNIATTQAGFDTVFGDERGRPLPYRLAQQRAAETYARLNARRIKQAATREGAKVLAELDAMDKDLFWRIPIDKDGYIVSPVHPFTRPKATAWAAVIDLDEDNDITMSFAGGGRRDNRYNAEDFKVGTAVEFGTNDRNSRGEMRGRERMRGVVVARSRWSLVFVETRGPKTTVKAARRWKPALPYLAEQRVSGRDLAA